MAGMLQSIIKLSANFTAERLSRDVYTGMGDARKQGKKIGQAFNQGINEGAKTSIGSLGAIPSMDAQLLKNTVQKRLEKNLEQIDNITDKSLRAALSGGKLNRTNTSLSKLAQIAAVNNYSMPEIIKNPGVMMGALGRTGALDVLRVLDRNSFKGYDSLVSNSVKEMRELNQHSIKNRVSSAFQNPNSYKPSIATVGGVNAGHPILNRSAAYSLGSFMGSPAGMAIGMGASGMYSANQGIQTLADYDTMFRQTSAYMGGENPLKTFNELLRDPLEDAAFQYGLSIKELNNYVMEAIKSGFDPKNIASSLDSVAGLKRSYALSVPAITELIVMANNQGWIDPADPDSINKHIAKLITMVSKTKGSLGDYSGSLSYAQTLLSAPEMTDTDYITLMGIMSNSNIKGTRGGRSMAHFFQRLLVPDSSADKVQDSIINGFKKDGINVTGADMNKLSDYFGKLGWSMYNKEGKVKIGEGMQYANYTEAIVDLMKTIDTAKKSGKMTDSDFQKFGGEFGQIAQRVFTYLADNYGDLTALRSDLVATESNSENIIKAVLNDSTQGIGMARDQFNSSLEALGLAALKLEGSFQVLENSLEGLIWLMQKISGGMESFSTRKDDSDQAWAIQMQAIKMEKVMQNRVLSGKDKKLIDFSTAPSWLQREIYEEALNSPNLNIAEQITAYSPLRSDNRKSAYNYSAIPDNVAWAVDRGYTFQNHEDMLSQAEETRADNIARNTVLQQYWGTGASLVPNSYLPQPTATSNSNFYGLPPQAPIVIEVNNNTNHDITVEESSSPVDTTLNQKG